MDKETKFIKTIINLPVINVPKNSNVISSDMIYKGKANDDESMRLKARIAPLETRNELNPHPKPTQLNVHPTGIRIMCSIASIMTWNFVKIDFMSAFLQTGDAKRDVYANPPRECKNRSF